jgi:hypothetical protein
VMLTIESAASEARYVPVLPWSVFPDVALDVWCVLPRPPSSENSREEMPVPLSSTIQLPRPKFTEISIFVASASKAFSSRARMTPDRLVICLEELIREMASSDSGKIRAGIDVGLIVRRMARSGSVPYGVVSRWCPLCVVVAG